MRKRERDYSNWNLKINECIFKLVEETWVKSVMKKLDLVFTFCDFIKAFACLSEEVGRRRGERERDKVKGMCFLRN